VPFLIFLKSFEVLLYEVMSWLVFYPRTLWRAVRHPLRLMERTEGELKLAPAEQFKDLVSPPIFLLLTVVAANGIEVAVVGHSALIDSGIGLAAMITDNTSLILFRLVAFASLPVIAGVFALAVMRRPVDRDTLQPMFYAQCYATTPVVLRRDADPPAATGGQYSGGTHLHCRHPVLCRRGSVLVCPGSETAGAARRLMGDLGVRHVRTGAERDGPVVHRDIGLNSMHRLDSLDA
jgi:hypothetical protein